MPTEEEIEAIRRESRSEVQPINKKIAERVAPIHTLKLNLIKAENIIRRFDNTDQTDLVLLEYACKNISTDFEADLCYGGFLSIGFSQNVYEGQVVNLRLANAKELLQEGDKYNVSYDWDTQIKAINLAEKSS